MEFSGEELTFKRIFNYIFGLFLITLGVAFSIKSGLGSTPVASIPYALNLILKWDLGITTFYVLGSSYLTWRAFYFPNSVTKQGRVVVSQYPRHLGKLGIHMHHVNLSTFRSQ